MPLPRLLPLAIALFGAALASQFPEFYQQYLQRLSGQLDQARARVAEIRTDAAGYGLSIEAYIQSFLDSPAHSREGRRMEESFHLAERMENAVAALATAPGWMRPAAFAGSFHGPTALATYNSFAPAVPLTPQGLAYGGVGALLALLLRALVGRGVRALRGSRAGATAGPPA